MLRRALGVVVFAWLLAAIVPVRAGVVSGSLYSDMPSAYAACEARVAADAPPATAYTWSCQYQVKAPVHNNLCPGSGNNQTGQYALGHSGDFSDFADFSWCGLATPTSCVEGTTSVIAYSWVDGTNCDVSLCDLSLMVQICSAGAGGCGADPTGSYVQTGLVCPYSPSDSSHKQTTPPTTPPPQSCSPDGTCTYCDSTGTYCVTSSPTPPAPPAPPAPSTSGACATATCSTTGGTGGAPAGGSTSGAPPSGSTSGGSLPPSGSSISTKCTTGVCDVGNADGDIGGLYQHSNDTPQSMYSTYMAQVKNAPIVAATTGFFTVSASGSCPSWHIPGNDYWGKAGFDFTFFCDPAMLALFQIAGFMVLAGGAFCAFRIAIY